MKQRTFTAIVKEEFTRYGGIAFCIIAAVCYSTYCYLPVGMGRKRKDQGPVPGRE